MKTTNRPGRFIAAILVCAGLAGLTLLALPDDAAAQQTRDRGDRYQRATGGSSSSARSSARERTRSSDPSPSRSSSSARQERSPERSRPAFTPREVRRDDGRSRTRYEDNTRLETGRDRGERYDRARTAAGTQYRDFDRRDRDDVRDSRNSRVRRSGYYDGDVVRDFDLDRRYGYRPAFPRYYTPYYGPSVRTGYYRNVGPRSSLSLRYDSYGDDFYNGYYGRDPFTPGGVYRDSAYHIPDGYVAPRYYYQTYRRTPVYQPYGNGFDADAVPAYGVRNTYDSSYDGRGVVTETTTYSTGGGYLPGFFPYGGFSSAYTGRDYDPFAFGCAPRTSVSYGLSLDLGGDRRYPRYSYGNAPRYGTGVSVEYNSYSR